MKISYVIPAYNTEKYIGQCIESVLKQKHHEQIIIINDGSTDGTLDVIKSFTDKSITVINHTENKGCCYSRMEGLRLCTGNYMTFIDSDDYYLKQLPKPGLFGEDIIDYGLFGAFNSTDNPKKVCSVCQKLYDEEIWQMYRSKQINQILINKLFSKKIYTLVRDNLMIDDMENYCDNICLMSAFAYYARSYRCVDDVFYFYRQGTGMTTYLSKLEKMRQYCEQKKAIPRMKALGMPTDSIVKEMMQRAYSQYKWMEKISKLDSDKKCPIHITAEDAFAARELFFNTFSEEYEKYGIDENIN